MAGLVPAYLSVVMAGLVPAISIRIALRVPKRVRRDKRAFTPVFDVLCPAMTNSSYFCQPNICAVRSSTGLGTAAAWRISAAISAPDCGRISMACCAASARNA